MGARRLVPQGGAWYIPGRENDIHGDFLLNEAEFYSISKLIPLVATISRGDKRDGDHHLRNFGCACLTRKDAETVELILAAIRSASFYDHIHMSPQGPSRREAAD